MLCEPFAVPDVYISGLGSVEDLGDGNFRFTFFAIKRGEPEVVASLIAPMRVVPQAICMAAKAIGLNVVQCWAHKH